MPRHHGNQRPTSGPWWRTSNTSCWPNTPVLRRSIARWRLRGRLSKTNPNRGLPIEAIIDRTWKPREIAPPIATPQGGGTLAYWVACFRSCSHVLAALAVELDGKHLDSIVFPHFLCGPLDARQRLEFLRFHMDRHLAQIQAVRVRR